MTDRRRDPRRRHNRPVPEILEDRRLLASLAGIANLKVPAQQGYVQVLDGSGTTDAQTFTITRTSGSADITASIPQGKFWTINIQYTDPNNSANNFSGPLVFQLFDNLTPNTASEIETFTTNGYYNGKNFARIATGFPSSSDYILQAGAPNADGTGSSGQPGTPFLNENLQQLAFTGTYQLAMANAGVNTNLSNYTQGVNTNDSQFFITTGSPNSVLSYGYTIFGQMLTGQSTVTKMTQVPLVNSSVYGATVTPANPIVMSSVTLSTTNPSGVALIDTTQARPGDTATFQVTATDPTDGSTVTQSFTVTAGAYPGTALPAGTYNPLKYPAIDFRPLADPASATVAENHSTTISLQGHDGSPNPDTSNPRTLTYLKVADPSHGTVSIDSTTGAAVYTPQPGYSGPDSFQYQVEENGPYRLISATLGLYASPLNTYSDVVTVPITVTPSQTPTITWSNPADITYGTALGSAQLGATTSVPGTFTYSPAIGTVLHAGAGQVLSVTFTPNDTTDYNTATATVKINVNKATPTIAWGIPADITQGTALGSAQLGATASVPGTFAYSPGIGTVLPAGAGKTLSVLFTPTDTTDYTTATASVIINVAAPDPTGTPTVVGSLTGVDDVTNRKHQVTALTLTFDGSIDPAAAGQTATYALIHQGKHHTFNLKRGPKIKIKSASYDPSRHTVTLIPRKPFASKKPVQVFIGSQPVSIL
jgi:cyclophilin family peptidyl-prolyl cis-trans isomerase